MQLPIASDDELKRNFLRAVFRRHGTYTAACYTSSTLQELRYCHSDHCAGERLLLQCSDRSRPIAGSSRCRCPRAHLWYCRQCLLLLTRQHSSCERRSALALCIPPPNILGSVCEENLTTKGEHRHHITLLDSQSPRRLLLVSSRSSA